MKNNPKAPQHPGVKNLADLKAFEGMLKAAPKHQLRFVEIMLTFITSRPDLVTSEGKAMLLPLLGNSAKALRR